MFSKQEYSFFCTRLQIKTEATDNRSPFLCFVFRINAFPSLHDKDYKKIFTQLCYFTIM